MKAYLTHFRDKRFLISCVLGLTFLVLAIVTNYYASVYATDHASGAVNDLILNNIPVFDVDGIFVYGPFIFWAFVAFLCIRKPQRIPFVAKSVALLIIIRAGFVTLTHIGPFPNEVLVNYNSDWIAWFSQGGDLFFSNHTATPFLMALVFGAVKGAWLWIFTGVAVFFGAIVLMGHLHYSIDVASAFFITYSVYHMALYFFKRDAGAFKTA
jgi:hypothetical protein